MESLKFRLILQEKGTEALINNISEDNMSFLIKKSILKLFGEFTLGKIYFSLKKPDSNKNDYQISFLSSFKNELKTSLLMMSDLEYNIRIFFI